MRLYDCGTKANRMAGPKHEQVVALETSTAALRAQVVGGVQICRDSRLSIGISGDAYLMMVMSLTIWRILQMMTRRRMKMMRVITATGVETG